MSSLKEFKKAGKKNLWDFKSTVEYPAAFGYAKTNVYELVCSHALQAVSSVELVVAIDKREEDWGFTEALGKYAVELTVDLLSGDFDDPEWKAEYTKWLKSQLVKLGKPSDF